MYNRNDGQNQAQTTSRPLENTGAPLISTLELAHTYLGDSTVFLSCNLGQKGPRKNGWEKSTRTLTRSDLHGEKNDPYVTELKSGNIGVLLGPNSNNLIVVDCDSEAFREAFEKLNPELCANTLQTKGKKGGHFWFRIVGEYPQSRMKITPNHPNAATEKSSDFLGAGCCMVAGLHEVSTPEIPIYYQIINPLPPLEIPFDAIKWPEGYSYPWMRSVDQEIAGVDGPAFTTNQHGIACKINAAFFAEWFRSHLKVVYDEARGCFFLYNPANGLWELQSDIAIAERIWKVCSAWVNSQESDQRDALKMLFTQKMRLDIVAILKSKIIESGFFENGPFLGGRGKIFHTREGMCYWNPEATKWGDAFHEIPFLPDFRSRRQFPCRLVEKPKCPMFDSLLKGLVGEEDREFMIKFLGYQLIEGNPGQHAGVIKGPSGLGKSQLIIVLQGLSPMGSWGQLRTNQLDGRFEVGSFADKHGLIGPDVAAQFLSSDGAKNLKSLTGGDLLEGELKFSNMRNSVRGDKHVLITTNNHLSLAPGEDVSAWQSRLILIETLPKRPERQIPKLGARILDSERDAVFTKLMRGAWIALRELEDNGRLTIPEKFRLSGSDVVRVTGSITEWVDTCISSGDRPYPTEKLHALYSSWCQKRGLTPVGKTNFSRDLRKLLGEHGINPCHNVLNTSAKHCNGYRGLEVIE